jgi:putative DNA primase/helicase
MENRILEAATKYKASGLSVIPLEGKRPAVAWKEYQERRADNSELWEWFDGRTDRNLGIVTGEVSGRLLVVDWDDEALYADWCAHHPRLAKTRIAVTGRGGHHTYYRLQNGGDALTTQAFTWQGKHGGEIRYNGGQVVAPPSVHPDTGQAYRWLHEDMITMELGKWEDLGLELAKKVAEPRGDPGGKIPEGMRDNWLTSLAGSLRRVGLGEEGLIAALTTANLEQCAPPLEHDQVLKIAASVARYPPAPPVAGEAVMAPIESHLTDMGNAARFALQHRGNVLYCHPWGKWLMWDGARWGSDQAGEIARLAKETVASIYIEAAHGGDAETRKRVASHAQKSEAAPRVRAFLELARSETGIPVLPESLDTEPWLLNTMNGTLDLSANEFREHRSGDLITKVTPCHYDPEAKAPRWDRFLEEIFDGNKNLIGFLQRALGYALTGTTREHVLIILHGVGSNGKTTLCETVAAVLGEDYAQRAPVELLLRKWRDSVPTDVARLRGARFVTAIETDQGRRLAESLVKALTGGDKLTARFMRQDYFEFVPTHKLFLATNHRPEIWGTDLAMWRRVKLVPFSVVIPDEKQDKDLGEKLQEEAPGILAWMVRGCRDWLENGLGEPQEVKDATATYRAEMDILGEFLEDCCIIADGATATTGDLYQRYGEWCDQNKEKAISKRAFGSRLRERGLIAVRDYATGRFYKGIGLRDTESQGELDF